MTIMSVLRAIMSHNLDVRQMVSYQGFTQQRLSTLADASASLEYGLPPSQSIQVLKTCNLRPYSEIFNSTMMALRLTRRWRSADAFDED